MRLELSDGFKQVVGDDSPANNSGTCYEGQTGTTPCKTIGLFSPQAGGILPPTRLFGNPNYPLGVFLMNFRAQVGGLDVGTAATDTAIFFDNIPKETCFKLSELTNGTYGSSTTWPLVPSAAGFSLWYWDSQSNSWTFEANGDPGLDFYADSGCWDDSAPSDPWFIFFAIIKEN